MQAPVDNPVDGALEVPAALNGFGCPLSPGQRLQDAIEGTVQDQASARVEA